MGIVTYDFTRHPDGNPQPHLIMNWLHHGWVDYCGLCNNFVGRAKYKMQDVPVCNKCYKAYRKTKDQELVARANRKILEVKREQELAKKKPETLDEYAKSKW